MGRLVFPHSPHWTSVNVVPNKKIIREVLTMSILSFSGPRFTTRQMTLASMLIALQVVLGKLSVGDPAVVKVGLGFIATALIGYFLGDRKSVV